MTPVKGPSSWKWLLRQVYARMQREFEQKCKACNGTGQHLKPVFCSHKQRYIYSLYDYDYSMKSLNTTRNGLQMIELWPMIIIYNYIYNMCVSKRNLLNAIRERHQHFPRGWGYVGWFGPQGALATSNLATSETKKKTWESCSVNAC